MTSNGMNERLSWEAPEFVPRPKGRDWLWVVGIIITALSIAAFLNGNVLFGFIIILGGVLILFYGHTEPKQTTFAITDSGVRAGSTFFSYDRIEAWSIREEQDHLVLVLFTERLLGDETILPFPDDLEDDIRDTLEEYIPEEDRPKGLLDTISDYLGL